MDRARAVSAGQGPDRVSHSARRSAGAGGWLLHEALRAHTLDGAVAHRS